MTVNGEWSFDQTVSPVSTVGSTWNLVKIGQVVLEELFNNYDLYTYTAQEQGQVTLAE